jgi:hypothetical protein
MTVRRLVLVLGAVALVAGLIGLLVPVSISDGNGGSVGCGNAVSVDLAGAQAANDKTVANVPILNQIIPHTDYVAQCKSSVASRRAWTIPLAVIGVLVAVGAVVARGRSGAGQASL